MIKTAIAVSAAVILASPSHAQTRAISAAERTLITNTYGNRLKDAASAQYKMPPIPLADNQTDGTTVYCFEVNAKNSYGAYGGFKMIVGKVTRSKGKVVSYRYDGNSEDDARSFPSATVNLCKVFGYTPS